MVFARRLRGQWIGVLAVLAFAAAYGGVAIAMVRQWAANEMYSYAFAVVPLSAYVAWHRLRHSPAVQVAPDYILALPLLGVAALLLIAGELGSVLLVQETSLLLAVFGIVLLLVGRRMALFLWFPLAYLAFMVPGWDFVISRLHQSSQLLSARLATAVLHGLHIPALNTETFIILPKITLEVARECSGVHQLVAVLAIALPAAYIMLTGVWRRVFLVVFSLLVALVSNGLRIALIGVWTDRGLPGDVHGPLHALQGLFVAGVGYVVIFLTLTALAKRGGDIKEPARESASAVVVPPVARRYALDAIALVGLMFVGALKLYAHPADAPLSNSFRSFPSRLGGWTADVSARPTHGDFHLKGVDEEFTRTYVNAEGRRVRLYIGYFKRQEQGRELVGDTTLALVNAASKADVVVDQQTGAAMNHVVRLHGGKPVETIFWYDLNGRVLANAYAAKAYSIQDAIVRGRTNGALVVVDWENPSTDDKASADREWEFVQAVLPVLRSHLPS